MKIVHLCLSNFYIDRVKYQENELIAQHVQDGHETIVVTSTENFDNTGKVIYVEPSEYIGQEGAKIYRLPYHPLIPHKVCRKLRAHKNVLSHLTNFNPDVILFHGLCGWELLTAAKYKKANPAVKLYADSHEDWNNSARGFISREILHKLYYKNIIQRALPSIEKVLCISTETMDFVEEVYNVNRSDLEFFPLGGHPIADNEYNKIRKKARQQLGISNELVFLQSGKQTKRKKLLESLKAFSSIDDPNFRFFIVGSLFDDIKDEAELLIEADGRISFLGWQSADDLNKLLCATDVYLQPGTQSVTMQHSLCAHCAVIIDDVPAHKPYMNNNGWLINKASPLEFILNVITTHKKEIKNMGQQSYILAIQLLDYSKLSRRVFK